MSPSEYKKIVRQINRTIKKGNAAANKPVLLDRLAKKLLSLNAKLPEGNKADAKWL